MQYTRLTKVQVNCCFTWNVWLEPLIVGRKEGNGQVLHLLQLHGKLPCGITVVLGVEEKWSNVTRREQSLQKADKGREENAGGMLLEVEEMVSYDPWDVGAVEVENNDQWDPIGFDWDHFLWYNLVHAYSIPNTSHISMALSQQFAEASDYLQLQHTTVLLGQYLCLRFAAVLQQSTLK
eukprot:g42700.t1